MCNTNFSGRTYGRTDVRTYRQCSLQGHSLPFVLLLKSIDSGYSLEPRQIEYPQSVLGEKVRKCHNFSSEKF